MADPKATATTIKGMSLAEIEAHTRRVTDEDIAQVTPEQIQAVLQTVSKEQLRTAMRAMIDNHRTQDLLMKTKLENFDAALCGVTTEHLAETALQMQGNPSFQAELLDSMSDAHRTKCTEHLVRRQSAAKTQAQVNPPK